MDNITIEANHIFQVEQMSSPLKQDLEAKEVTLFDRTFRDSEGNIVIAQAPNLPILVGTVATLLQSVLPISETKTVSGLIAFGTLFTWAWQELFEGVNYFRRALGLIGLVSLVVIGLNLTR